MKVLHIFDRSIPNLSGYSIRSKYIVDFQKTIGIDPFVVTSPKERSSKTYDEINDTPYFRTQSDFSLLSKIPFLREQKLINILYQKIIDICAKYNIDILHAHSPSLCGLAGLKAAQKLKIPLVYEVRAFWEDAAVDMGRFKENSLKYKISQYMEGKLFKNADSVVCICQGLKEEISSRIKRDDIYIVENGVDTKAFSPRPKDKALVSQYNLSGKTVIGFIGSFFKFEGIDLLIKAASSLKGNKDIIFLIVGTGIEDDYLRNLAKSLGVLDKNVIFTGRVPHENILDYYSVMDILVYPRINKRITELTTPLKPLEAMAMEKAVVVSDVGGLKELIKDGETGVLFKAGDVSDLTEKIRTLAFDPNRRKVLGLSARVDVIEHRDWSKIVPKYLQIYTQMISDAARR